MDLQNESHCAKMLKEFELTTNPLSEMYFRQKLYQESVAIKNNTTLDNLVGDVERCFYWLGCMNIEFLEMINWYKVATELNKSTEQHLKIDEAIVEAQFEYIDAYHFLMNFFIYANVDEIKLDFFNIYPEIQNTDVFSKDFFDKLNSKIGAFNMKLCENLNQTDFKTWKKHNPKYEYTYKYTEIFKDFFEIGAFLRITPQLFYNLYRSKLEENHRRQMKGGKYFER